MLAERWRNYERSLYWDAKIGEITYRLPSPLGLGLIWYDAAKEAIIVDLERVDDVKTWKSSWRAFELFTSGNYDTAVDTYLWEKWSEGIALMGFVEAD